MATTSKDQGKTALVTGGSRGIGAAIARRLAKEGYNVVLTYAKGREQAERVAQAIVQEGGKAIALQADSSDAEAVHAAVHKTARTFGRLDVLVANAGILVVAPLERFTLEDFDRLMAVNVRGVFVAAQAAAAHMQRGGRIILIGSVNADRVPFAGGGPYAMSKAALVGLARGLARDLGPRGITVNNVQPGPTDSEMNPEDAEAAEALRGHMAVGRYGHADEIAGMVAYLASPEASFVTGSSLTIDGGFAA